MLRRGQGATESCHGVRHAGRWPFLVRSGYRRVICATPATRDLSALMFDESTRAQAKGTESPGQQRMVRPVPLFIVWNFRSTESDRGATDPTIVIAAVGTPESGRIRHYTVYGADDHRDITSSPSPA